MPFKLTEGYSPLAQSSASSDSPDELPSKQSRLGVWTLLGCIVCTAISVLTLVVVPKNSTESPAACSRTLNMEDIPFLRRPNQFVGFDDLPHPIEPEPKQIMNFPSFVAQVDEADKEKVFEEDPKRYMAHIGTISPEDKVIRVTKTVSTVAQFRAIDWGMEICELHLTLPLNHTSSTKICDDGFTLSIWRLNTTMPLKARTLNYKNRPQRVAKLADMQLSRQDPDDVNYHRKFSCVTDELLTFELAFSSTNGDQNSNCYLEWDQERVEWWVKQEDPVPAFYMMQHSTAR